MGIERIIPRVAAYHSGPYKLAAVLQDPGTRFGSGCDAQRTGEVGVLNNDPTARMCKEALDANDIPIAAFLPLNALPWYDAPRSRNNALLREGARHNRKRIIESGVTLVLLLGKDAWRSERFLDLPPIIEVRRLPHPGKLGLIHYRENGIRLGPELARQRLIDGFALR